METTVTGVLSTVKALLDVVVTLPTWSVAVTATCAVVVLAILVYAASRQFPTYRNFKSPAAEQSQPH
jgi:hypothetical protein